MQTNKLTEDQCVRIISNSYLGEPSRGKQKDYGDYKELINQRLWSLQDKRLGKLVVEQSSPEYEFLRDCIKSVDQFDFNRVFNKWAYIAGGLV